MNRFSNLIIFLVILLFSITIISNCHKGIFKNSNDSTPLVDYEILMGTNVVQEYDEFEDETTLSLEYLILTSEDADYANLGFSISNRGKVINFPDSIQMKFIQINKHARFSNCNDLIFLVDNERFRFNKPYYSKENFKDVIIENLHYNSSFSFLEGLVTADSIRFKICNDIFSVDSTSTSYIKKYYEQIQALSKNSS